MLPDPEESKTDAVHRPAIWAATLILDSVEEAFGVTAPCGRSMAFNAVVKILDHYFPQGSQIPEVVAETSTAVQPECSYCWHVYKSMKCRHGGC